MLYITLMITAAIGAFALALGRFARDPDVCNRTQKYCGKAEDCECAACELPVDACKQCPHWNGCTTGGHGG